jgi:hypothetical protein
MAALRPMGNALETHRKPPVRHGLKGFLIDAMQRRRTDEI